MIPHKNEILHMERRYWEAMKNNDVEAAVALTKFPCVISGPQGARRVTEEQYRELMESMNGDEYKGIEIKDPHVDILTDDTALISYSTEVNGMKMLDVSTWVREDDKWVCAFHSENPVN